MDISQAIARNKVAAVICLLLVGVVICLSGVAYLIASATNSSQNKSVSKTVETSTTTKTVSSSSTSTSTSSSTSTTTTNKPSGSVAAAQTTTTLPAFNVLPSAVLVSQSGDICVGGEYTISGSLQSNRQGSATYLWIRSDGLDTGVGGTVSFDSNGTLIGSVSQYNFTLPPGPVSTGWVALKVIWEGGTSTSSQVTYQLLTPGSTGLGTLGC